MENKRIAAPEFWRFVFIMFVSLLHFEEDITNCTLHIVSNAGYLGVDFFLLLAGFGIAYKYGQSPKDFDPYTFCKKRLLSIYPTFLLAILIMFLVWVITASPSLTEIKQHIWENKFQYFFSNAFLPTGLEMRSLWFLSNWFWGVVCVSLILKYRYDKLFIVLAILFLSYISLYHGSLFRHFDVFGKHYDMNFFCTTSEILIGTLIYKIYSHTKEIKLSNLGYFLFSSIEIVCIIVVIKTMMFTGRDIRDFTVFMGFCLIIILSFSQKTFVSKLLNHRYCEYLGKLSMPIYLFHLPVSYLYGGGIIRFQSGKFAYISFIAIVLIVSMLVQYLSKKYLNTLFSKFLQALVVK